MFELSEILFFINRALFSMSLIPLVAKNYKLKTARGISDGLTFTLLNAYIALALYSFCLNLPIAFGVGALFQISMMCILIFQRFSYDDFSYKKKLAVLYISNVLFAALVSVISQIWPSYVGHIAGWVMFVFFFVNRIPQIIKIQRERSVYGFSYGFAFVMGLASLMEIVLFFVYGLPLQTLAAAVWAFISVLIFTAQFYFFAWRRKA